MTKPGVVHHFGTKEGLTIAVLNRIMDQWEADLRSRTTEDAGPVEKLRAYVDYALTGEFDPSDLVLMADVNLREQLSALWAQRLSPWLGTDVDADLPGRPSLVAARLLADSAWLNASLGIPALGESERSRVRAIALNFVNEGEIQ